MLTPTRRVALLIASGLIVAAVIALIVGAIAQGVSFVAWAIGIPPARSYARAHEDLPTVSVERGRVVYCRMRYCDFRFPLPDGSRVVRTNVAGGGFDTIRGSVDIAGSEGSKIDMDAYARLLRKAGFRVNFDSGSHALNVSTSNGGFVEVDSGRIRFSYFGDY